MRISETIKRVLDVNYVKEPEYTKLDTTYSLPDILLVTFVFPAVI